MPSTSTESARWPFITALCGVASLLVAVVQLVVGFSSGDDLRTAFVVGMAIQGVISLVLIGLGVSQLRRQRAGARQGA